MASKQAVQTSNRRHNLVRLMPFLAIGAFALYLNGKSNGDAEGRIGMDKLLNEPLPKDQPSLASMQDEKFYVPADPQKEQPKNLNEGANILLPTDPVASPSAKSAKAEGSKGGKSESKSKGGKSESKSKSKGAKAEGAKAEKQGGKSRGGKGGSKSKKSKGGAKSAKAEGAKAEKQGGKSKGGKGGSKSKGGAKSAKAAAEALDVNVNDEAEYEVVEEAESVIEDSE